MGVTGYALRPPVVPKGKEKVASFTSAKIDKILSLKPDLVRAFSDLQVKVAAELIKNSVAVKTGNQRDVAGILAMISHLGATVGASGKAEALLLRHEKRLMDLLMAQELIDRRSVDYEGSGSPMSTGIKWV